MKGSACGLSGVKGRHSPTLLYHPLLSIAAYSSPNACMTPMAWRATLKGAMMTRGSELANILAERTQSFNVMAVPDTDPEPPLRGATREGWHKYEPGSASDEGGKAVCDNGVLKETKNLARPVTKEGKRSVDNGVVEVQ